MARKRQKGVPYERLEDKGDRGAYELVVPLDYVIFELLHSEGETFAGLYPLAHTAEQITKEVTGGKITTSAMASRLVSLAKQGLIAKVNVLGAGGAIAYQRTARATKLLKEWKAEQSKAESDDS